MSTLDFLAGAIAMVGLAVIVRRSRRGPTATPVVLAAFPFAVLLLVAPIPLESFATIAAFRDAADSGRGGIPLMVSFANGMSRALLTGAIGFVAVLMAAGVAASFAKPPDAPPSSAQAGEGPLAEWFEVSPQSARLINAARAAGHRVIAVGTTATRAVESVAEIDGTVTSGSGWTQVVISPGRPIRTVDGLITGWHDPEASHLLLVEAVAGPALTQRAYDAAVDQRYRRHEFGDAGLFLR